MTGDRLITCREGLQTPAWLAPVSCPPPDVLGDRAPLPPRPVVLAISRQDEAFAHYRPLSNREDEFQRARSSQSGLALSAFRHDGFGPASSALIFLFFACRGPAHGRSMLEIRRRASSDEQSTMAQNAHRDHFALGAQAMPRTPVELRRQTRARSVTREADALAERCGEQMSSRSEQDLDRKRYRRPRRASWRILAVALTRGSLPAFAADSAEAGGEHEVEHFVCRSSSGRWHGRFDALVGGQRERL